MGGVLVFEHCMYCILSVINWYMWFAVEYWHVYCFPVLDIQFKETKYIVLNDNETVDDLVVIINNYMSSY